MKRNFSTGITSLDIVCGVLAAVICVRLITRMRRIPRGSRLPPGPPRKLIIGNVTDLTNGPIWEIFDRWAKVYGGIYHIDILGQSIVVVNSLDVARELFEKRSSIYSDRLNLPMLVDLVGMDWNWGLRRYGEMWRRHRRMFHQHFNSAAIFSYEDIQTKQTKKFLQRLEDSPNEFRHHIRYLFGAIIMEIVYGIETLPKCDPYIEAAQAAMTVGASVAVPGRFLVDTLPILKYVPEWVPGAGFKKKARKWRIIMTEAADKPFNAVKDALNSGIVKPSVATTLFEDLFRRTDAPADEEMLIRSVTAVAYAGGADTTVSSLTTFVLAMALHPEVQRKAQAELDTVIGNRLPTFEDRASLPYIAAICKEIHRWIPVLPLGVPHRLTEDDIYGEYFIPKGSIVIGNTWSILHEEKTYGPDPEKFNPERFLVPGAIDPIGQFGFGRRICAGRYLADNAIFIAIASILKVFDISPARDSDGNEIPVKVAFPSTMILQAEPFRCAIQPRSESVRVLLSHE